MSLLSICCGSGERPNSAAPDRLSSVGSFCQRIWDVVREIFLSLIRFFGNLMCSSPEYDFSTVAGVDYQVLREEIPPPTSQYFSMEVEVYSDEEDLDSMPGTPPPEDLLVQYEEYSSEGSDLDDPILEENDSRWAVPVASVRALPIRPQIKNGNFNPEWRSSLGADEPHQEIYTGRPLHSGNHRAARITMSGSVIPIYLPNK